MREREGTPKDSDADGVSNLIFMFSVSGEKHLSEFQHFLLDLWAFNVKL